MPYSGPNDKNLPDRVKKLDEKLRIAWIKAWNAAHKSCMEKQGDDCEGYAFGAAENVVKRIQEKADMSQADIDEMIDMVYPAGKSLDQISRQIWEAWNTSHNPESEIASSARHSYVQEIYDGYVVICQADKHYKAPYTVDGEKVKFAGEDMWQEVTEVRQWVSTAPDELEGLRLNGLLITELSDEALVDGRPFDGLAIGEFTDMSGRSVKFKEDELETYLANTLSAIEATKSESGEIVGLPIDARGHEKGDGAGWIVDASLDGSKLRFVPKWTEIGRDLISKGIRRFFSATVDTVNKVILGGTLTNWPATRDKKGRVLLRPVELQKPNLEADMTEDEIKKLIADGVAAAIKGQTPPAPATPDMNLESLLGLEGLSEQAKEQRKVELRAQMDALRKQAEMEYRVEMVRLQHEGKMAELAQELAGGNDAAPRGYRVAAEELQAHLLKLDPKEADFWGELLRKTQKDGFVEFAELGHGKDPKGGKPLPKEYAEKLDAGVLAIADLSSDAAGLGDLGQYDLSKWQK